MEDLLKEKVLELAVKLLTLSKDNGAFDNEAEVATKKLEELLLKYELTLDQVEAAVNGKRVERVVEEDIVLEINKAHGWWKVLILALTKVFNCRAIFDPVGGWKKYGRPMFLVMGYKADVEISTYLYDYLRRELHQLSSEYARARGFKGGKFVRSRNSFCLGAITRIRMRLEENKRQSVESNGQLKALVLVKGNAVSDYVKRRFDKLVSGGAVYKRDVEGSFSDGYEAGGKLSLRAGVKEDSNAGSKLLPEGRVL